jgi:hypothetical protein
MYSRIMIKLAMFLAIIALQFSVLNAQAGTPEDQDGRWAEALQRIEGAAQSFCGSFFTEGGSTRFSLDAAAKAKIAGLAKRLADADASIGGSYTSEHFEGVLQNELASSNATVAACKQHIFDNLKFMFQPIQQKFSGLAPSVPAMACGNSIIYYHPSNSNEYIPETVWTCRDQRIPTPIELPDAASRALVEEQHGQLEIVLGTDKIEWPIFNYKIYTIGLKTPVNRQFT